ncbi:DUF4892 domain-containing protein [Metapseudomonas otitidis]|uniref:DUF4892 domain-containing protein n=1 Tax=Metapseudomonas otitidis TaxID=319939 RepID=UPI00244A3C36|nr:DUF4892 domain-containing protein [Pseudomonas otitidis]MDG9784119.1 DUF4892 domain-containing protein [Pseudomonas otitidis]
MRFLPLCLGLALAAPLQAADLPESHDLAALPRFPHAEIVDFKEAPDQERFYPQGSIRRISNQLRMEQRVDVQGRQTSVTYRLPSGHSSAEAFDRARVDLMEKGAIPLYWCQGRDCGSSSLWANTVFGNARLYGPDDQQAYLLVRLAEPSQDSLLAVYAITRGNRRAYLHAEQLDAAAPLGELLPTPGTLLRELKSSGELHLPTLPAVPSEAWATLLARGLNLDSTLRVSLGGAGAEAWREALVGQGVRAARLELGASREAGLHLEWLR